MIAAGPISGTTRHDTAYRRGEGDPQVTGTIFTKRQKPARSEQIFFWGGGDQGRANAVI